MLVVLAHCMLEAISGILVGARVPIDIFVLGVASKAVLKSIIAVRTAILVVILFMKAIH